MPFTQMFENSLNIAAGYFGRGMLQKVVKVSSGSVSNAVAGRCGYIDNNGQWVHGPCPVNKGPAYFVFRGTNHRDVSNDGAMTSGSSYWWVSGNVQGYITVIPATGGFELQTTEYDTSRTYNNGDALTVGSDGKLTNNGITTYSSLIVGYCAPFTMMPENMRPATDTFTPTGTNAYRVPVLNFYTVFLPRIT